MRNQPLLIILTLCPETPSVRKYSHIQYGILDSGLSFFEDGNIFEEVRLNLQWGDTLFCGVDFIGQIILCLLEVN